LNVFRVGNFQTANINNVTKRDLGALHRQYILRTLYWLMEIIYMNK